MAKSILVILLLLLAASAVIYSVIFGAALSTQENCNALIAQGYDLVLVRATCYAKVGHGMYVPIMSLPVPKTLEQIKQDLG